MRTKIYFTFITWMLIAAQSINANDNKQFIKDMLKAHNRYRQLHYAKPLILDDFMTVYATDIANKVHQNQVISIPSNYGANIYVSENRNSPGADLNFKSVFMLWYNEGINYNYSKEPNSTEIVTSEHFTQILWKSTRKIGIAGVVNDQTTLIIILYYPPGNQINTFTENVIDPLNFKYNK